MARSKKLTLIQINDVHAYLSLHPEIFWEKGAAVYRQAGGYERISTLVKQMRAGEPGGSLFFDNGDTLHGTYPAVATQGKALVPILNRLGLDGMTAHWEFAYGPRVFQDRASELEYPVLAINVKNRDSKERVFPECLVKEAGGIRVGIIGVASNIVDKTMPPSFSEGLSFDLDIEELRNRVAALRTQEKADLVVLLSHLGYPQDVHIAGEAPGIDVILSGHTHNRLAQPSRQGETLIIQSGSHGSFLGRLTLTVESGKITGYSHQLVEVSESVQPDPEMEALVREALQPFKDELATVVGETAVPLDRSLNLETTMDNLLLEAIAESMGTQLAFSNGWRYGAPVLPGPVTLNDLYNIIPVNPPVSTVEITGQELWDMLEENLEHTYSRHPLRQMGGYVKRSLGLKALFKVENPYPYRMQKLFIGEEEARPERTYTAAFVTEQGVPARYGNNRQTHDLRAVDAMRQYLAKHKSLEIRLNNPFVLI